MNIILGVTLLCLVAFCTQTQGFVPGLPIPASPLGPRGGGGGGNSYDAYRQSSFQYYDPRDRRHHIQNQYKAEGPPQVNSVLGLNTRAVVPVVTNLQRVA